MRLHVDTEIKKKRLVGFVLLAVLLALFLAFNRAPKLDTVQDDLAAVTGPQIQCFQGFCIEQERDAPLLSRWWKFSTTYLRLVTIGMTFAFLVAGLTEAFLFPRSSSQWLSSSGIKGSLKGLLIGAPMALCSACIVPVTSAFRRKGAGIEATISTVQASSTLNLPALLMLVVVFSPLLAGTRIAISVAGVLLLGWLAAFVSGRRQQQAEGVSIALETAEAASSWNAVLKEGLQHWGRASLGYLLRLGPIMVIAGLISGLAIQWLSPLTVGRFLGDNLLGVAVAATLGILINVPLLFEIPLVAALLLLGMGVAPAATLLFAAAAGGPITFWGLWKVLPRRAILTFVAATWALGVVGGLSVLGLAPLLGEDVSPARVAADPSTIVGAQGTDLPIVPFDNVSTQALRAGSQVWNDRPGVVIFDYDRDGDLDVYITSQGGHPNWLHRNNGDGTFTNVAEEAGVVAIESHSTGAVACDINNDGYQDLYVGAWGNPEDNLDFRSPSAGQGNRDSLFLNNGDGTFQEITDSAFEDRVNLRSATSIACADVDGDGYLDLYVGNLAAQDFRDFAGANHPGHYNVLYENNGDLTFSDVTLAAGVEGPGILMRDFDGERVLFEDAQTGRKFEGWDPNARDLLGNQIGEPTGQTHAVLFFDYDDDGDPDLFVANDGDRLHVYRNDSSPVKIQFTSVAKAMGIDPVGAWMGLAVGDYDGDADLDIFVANIGSVARLVAPMPVPNGSCQYHEQFYWGTCLHFLLRNDGTRDMPGVGVVGVFPNVAASTVVRRSPWMPPRALNPYDIWLDKEWPRGLSAYEFGFGATFFDYDNDADQDLYWLGSTLARGEAPLGGVLPGAGRMLRGDGKGGFEDITVRAHLLDILGVDYSRLGSDDVLVEQLRISVDYHENGKGLAHGDLNGDGYVDLIGTNSSGPRYIGDPLLDEVELIPGPVFVWMNGGGENHWITLRLQGRMAIDGTGSNADGIGARVYVITRPPDRGASLVQVQEVRAGSSYLSMDSLDLEFGLGDATAVDSVMIRWPSGRTQLLKDLGVDQVITVTEPQG